MMTTRNEAGSGFQAPPNGLIKSDFQTKLAMNKGKQFLGEKKYSRPTACVYGFRRPKSSSRHRPPPRWALATTSVAPSNLPNTTITTRTGSRTAPPTSIAIGTACRHDTTTTTGTTIITIGRRTKTVRSGSGRRSGHGGTRRGTARSGPGDGRRSTRMMRTMTASAAGDPRTTTTGTRSRRRWRPWRKLTMRRRRSGVSQPEQTGKNRVEITEELKKKT
jgi:hypothetical protein